MKSRSSTIIGAGVAVAILGAALVFLYAHRPAGIRGPPPQGPASPPSSPRTAIPIGTKSDSLSDYVKGQAVPASSRPADALTSLSQITDPPDAPHHQHR